MFAKIKEAMKHVGMTKIKKYAVDAVINYKEDGVWKTERHSSRVFDTRQEAVDHVAWLTRNNNTFTFEAECTINDVWVWVNK